MLSRILTFVREHGEEVVFYFTTSLLLIACFSSFVSAICMLLLILV